MELVDDSKVTPFFINFSSFFRFAVYVVFMFMKSTGYGRVDESSTRKDLVKMDEFPFEESRVQEDCHKLLL